MIKLAANLGFMYQEVPLPDRFSLAAKDGFKGVEFLFPYEWPATNIKARLDENGLTQALFNLYPGDWASGERGLASLPGKEQDFENSLLQALDYAANLRCDHLHVMAGLRQPDISTHAQQDIFIRNLSKAVLKAQTYDITLLIEPINQIDMPAYFLDSFEMAADIITRIDHPSLKLQFDIYHCQRIKGSVAHSLTKYLPMTGHIQIADTPGRHEPGSGEINFQYLFDIIKKNKYTGWVGCEYIPSTTTSKTLGWAEQYSAPPKP